MENFKDMDALSQNLINMKDSLRMDNTMEKESTLGALAMSMKALTKMEKNMDMGFIQVLTVLSTKATGKMEKEMEKESKYLHQDR